MNFREIYPSLDEVESYWREALSETPRDVEPFERFERSLQPGEASDRHVGLGVWLRFRGVDGSPFWCLWQGCPRPGVHKALVHLPGYGTETSVHPSLVHRGYHVLHINPRGYCGPDGFGNLEWREQDGTATVLYRKMGKPEEYGYRLWFQDAVLALRWLRHQPGIDDRFGFFGSSQGGGAALILASILAGEGFVGSVAADVPFLTNFPMVYPRKSKGAYEIVFSRLPKEEKRLQRCFRTLGFIDTVVHAPRMRYPVLLTAGERDEACPSDTIHSLYGMLPDTRCIVEFHGQAHGYTPNFPSLAETWFNLYV